MKYKIVTLLLLFSIIVICIFTTNTILITPQGHINIIISEGPYWKPIIDANGGINTAKGSIYDKMGLKIHLSIINDFEYSYKTLVNNQAIAAGYSISQYALLDDDILTIPYIVSSSNGEYGIIANGGINQIEDFANRKIGVVRFSDGEILTKWLISKSNLLDKNSIKYVYFNTPKEAAEAVLANKIDIAATWEPYLSNSGKVIFSTKNANNLVLYGLTFRKDYINTNKDIVKKIVEGALLAEENRDNLDHLKQTIPTYSIMKDGDIKKIVNNININSYIENKQLFNGILNSLITDIAFLWDINQENKDPFDGSVILSLEDKFIEQKPQPIEPNKESTNILLQQRLSINFEVNEKDIKQESLKILDEFINTANVLDNTFIQIEGNCSSDGSIELNYKLSLQRAQSIANYFVSKGIDKDRLIIIGNGSDKPIGDNKTEEGRILNRRTDIFFKVAN